MKRPHTTVVLAMSADGKIADRQRSPARFGSSVDQTHLETQIAKADGVLFGAGTLRAYGTTLPITNPDLLYHRQQDGRVPQPVHIVCSQSGRLNPDARFFQQSVPRWLLTTQQGLAEWRSLYAARETPTVGDGFERTIVAQTPDDAIDWWEGFQQFKTAGLEMLVICGGGKLVASLLAIGFVDELWLTVCPLLLGGDQTPSPVDGAGFITDLAPRLELIDVRAIAHEVFLHYRVRAYPKTQFPGAPS